MLIRTCSSDLQLLFCTVCNKPVQFGQRLFVYLMVVNQFQPAFAHGVIGMIGLQLDQFRPRTALVAADCRDDVRRVVPLVASGRGQQTQPIAVLGDHHVRLVAIPLVGNNEAGADIARVANHQRLRIGAELSNVGCGERGNEMADVLEEVAFQTTQRLLERWEGDDESS